jgi:hypothetical protein
MKQIYLTLILLLFCIVTGNAQETELFKRLQQFKDIEIKPIEKKGFGECYELMIPQAIDHKHPESGSFMQRVFLSHISTSAPVIYVTEGYAAHGISNEELARMFNANTIVVEHRNFGKSIADTITWANMTVEQAAADHHSICQLLKQIYTGKWIATGVSKGGQTALCYRAYYPNDVDVTVAYVAPINFAVEDRRLDAHIKKMGDAECQKKILDFQFKLLKNKDYFVPAFAGYCKKKELKLILDPETTFDYEVLEYPFGFWQYGTPCDSIPGTEASNETILKHLVEVVTPFYYTAVGVNFFKPFFYQANYELGYYGYDEKPFRKYLKQSDYPNTIWGPTGKIMPYNAKTMKFVNHFLQNEGDRIIYIYGENDPWSASQVKLKGKTDALKVLIAKGDHSADISLMSELQRAEVYEKLEKWLGIKIAVK